jgi:hypothetical protein
MRFNVVAVINHACEAVPEMHMVPGNRARQCAMQIGTVKWLTTDKVSRVTTCHPFARDGLSLLESSGCATA